MNVESDKNRIFHLSLAENPELHHQKLPQQLTVVFSFHDYLRKELFTLQITDYTTDLFHDEIYYMDVLLTLLAMLFVIFSSAN